MRYAGAPRGDVSRPFPEGGATLSTKKRSAWLLGCGLGCGALVLLAAGLAGAGWVLLDRTVRGFDEAVAARAALQERHGRPDQFTPRPDGSIEPARMEAFLHVREATQPSRAALAGTFDRMPMSPGEAEAFDRKPFLEKLGMALSFGKEALSLGPRFGEFFGARSRAMLDAGIGEGEYAYLYTVAYYTWLGHAPADGPHTVARDARDGGPHEFQALGSQVMKRVRGDLIQMLRNQRASLPAGTSASWREALAREIAALEQDPDRLPWQDGLPAPMAASLEPYRGRLEAAYDPVTNPFELGRATQRGRWSYGTD